MMSILIDNPNKKNLANFRTLVDVKYTYGVPPFWQLRSLHHVRFVPSRSDCRKLTLLPFYSLIRTIFRRCSEEREQQELIRRI